MEPYKLGEKRDKYTVGRAMTGPSGKKKHLERNAASRRREGKRDRETERRDDVLNAICRLPSQQAAATDPGSPALINSV